MGTPTPRPAMRYLHQGDFAEIDQFVDFINQYTRSSFHDRKRDHAKFIDALDRFTSSEEKAVETAHRHLFHLAFAHSKPMSHSNISHQFPHGMNNQGDGYEPHVPPNSTASSFAANAAYNMEDDMQSSYPASQVPAELGPLFDSIGIHELNPYHHIQQPELTFSATQSGSSMASYPQPSFPPANAGQGQTAGQEVPFSTQPTPAPLPQPEPQPVNANPPTNNTGPVNSHTEWEEGGHLLPLVQHFTSSSTLYEFVMMTSRSVRNKNKARTVWGNYTSQAFPNQQFTPDYVGKKFMIAAETVHDLVEIGGHNVSEAVLRDVSAYTAYIKYRIEGELEAAGGMFVRFRASYVPTYFGDLNNGVFARIWRCLLVSKKSMRPLGQRTPSLLHGPPFIQGVVLPAEFLQANGIQAEGIQVDGSVASIPTTSAPTFPMASESFASASVASAPIANAAPQMANGNVLHPNPVTPGGNSPQPGPTHGPRQRSTPDDDLERRVRPRTGSAPSQAELVRQGAALTDGQLVNLRKKGAFMDTLSKTSSTNDMATIHTDVIAKLATAATQLIGAQGSLVLQAYSTGATMSSSSSATVGADTHMAGPSDQEGTSAAPTGDPLSNRALAHFERLLAVNHVDTLDRIVTAATRVVAASMPPQASTSQPPSDDAIAMEAGLTDHEDYVNVEAPSEPSAHIEEVSPTEPPAEI